MSLEISEIGIRMTVGDPGPALRAGRPNASSTGQEHAALTPQQIEELIQRCVQAVLETLRMAEGR
jgi:hypothetical protein